MEYTVEYEKLYAESNIIMGIEMAGININIVGVIVALALSIILIIRKLNPALALFLGTVVGALIGGASLFQTLDIVMLGGRQSVRIVITIIAGAVLAGTLIESGAAESIARGIVRGLGEKRAVIAIALSAMMLTGVGVFLPVMAIIIAPIALSVAFKANVSKFAALLAISGGSKAGNMISPNPNAIAAADVFDLYLSEVMIYGAVPAAIGIIATIIICSMMKKRGFMVKKEDMDNIDESGKGLPSFKTAIIAPVLTIGLLMLNPIGDIAGISFLMSKNLPLDPFFVLPLAAVIGTICMGKGKHVADYATKGVLRLAPIVLMLIGASALGVLITHSVFPGMIENAMIALGMPAVLLAPISGTIFGGAVGSTAVGVVIAGGSFSGTLLAAGVSGVAAAVMIHVGAGFIDIVPHGNYFLASHQGMKTTIKERISVMPWEALIGGIMTVGVTLIYGFIWIV